MATVVNNPQPAQQPVQPVQQQNNGNGFLIGVILLIVVLIAFFYYGLPYLGTMGQAQPVVPEQIDVNVQQPQ